METLTRTQTISVEPRFFYSNIHSHLYERLQKKLKGTCTQEHGYVVEIEDDLVIIDNELSGTSASMLVTLQFKVKTLKPREGQILEGKVCMIFEQGIFVDVQEKMKVLLPLENVGKYKYCDEKGIFKYKKKTISVGDIVKIKIDRIEYKKKAFNCIGFLEV